MDNSHTYNEKTRKTRKIMTVKPSKYEGSSPIHDNKRHWNKVFQNMNKTTIDPSEEIQSRQLSEILPSEIYKKVCNALKMPIVQETTVKEDEVSEHPPRRLKKKPMISFRTSLVVDREMDSDTDVEASSSDGEEKPNVHRELLNKPEREQITWDTHYLQPEKEDEKSLVRKADDLTDRIANEFCGFMAQLGGKQQSQLFTPKAIKELFQIEFDTHVARSLRVVPKELPAVSERVANATKNPEKSLQAALEREVLRDIKVEQRPDKTQAFGQSLPRKEQWYAPRNDTKNMWRSARHVPKDLVTLKTVWEGITNLRSVKEYCLWMIDHPEYRRAPYLMSLGMFDPAVLEARMSYDLKHSPPSPALDTPDDAPAPIDHIRRRLSELAETS